MRAHHRSPAVAHAPLVAVFARVGVNAGPPQLLRHGEQEHAVRAHIRLRCAKGGRRRRHNRNRRRDEPCPSAGNCVKPWCSAGSPLSPSAAPLSSLPGCAAARVDARNKGEGCPTAILR